MIKYFTFNSNQWSDERFNQEITDKGITKDNIIGITQNYNNYTIFYDINDEDDQIVKELRNHMKTKLLKEQKSNI